MKQSNKLLICYAFFILGLSLIIFSWIKSYPITLIDYKDITIKHVNPSYFFGLSMSLVSLLFIMINTKRTVNKIFCIFGFVLLFYSINFFYPLLPGPDSQYFRGLTNYFLETKNPNINANQYFQWPGLFIFAKTISLLTKIKDINTLSIIIFLLVGFILSISLYFIFRWANKEYAPVLTLIYFYIMFYFINYQYAAQSLAIAILFGMIALTFNKERDNRIWIIILFCFLVITHAFMAAFFILYLISYLILSRIFKSKEINKNLCWRLVLICSIIYFLYISFVAINLFKSLGKVIEKSALNNQKINVGIFAEYINLAIKRPVAYNDYLVQKEVLNLSYSKINETEIMELMNTTNSSDIPPEILETLKSSVEPIVVDTTDKTFSWIELNNYSQIVSRTLIISLIILLMLGFIILFFQGKIKIEILAIGFAGFSYMVFGTLVNVLGERGIQIITVPLVSGAFFFLDKKMIKKTFFVYAIILLISFSLVIFHSNFDNRFYQEYHEKNLADFFINYINSVPNEEKSNDYFYISGRHDIIYYIVGSLDLSPYLWKSNPSDRYITNFNSFKNKDFKYLFYSENFKKSLVSIFKIDEKDLKEFDFKNSLRYNKEYNNFKSYMYSN